MTNALSIDAIDRPAAERSDHVVVEVQGAGWCQTDNHVVEGVWTDYVDHITDGRGARQILDFVGADETTALGPDLASGRGDHHVVGYGGRVHEPAQTLVDGELPYRGTLVGKYTELQELVAPVERGDVELRTSRCGLDDINAVAEKLEHSGIEGRAVVTP